MQNNFILTILVYNLVMVLQLQSKTATLNLCVDSLHSFFLYLRNTVGMPHLRVLILNG